MSKTLIVDVETNGLFGYTMMWCAVTYCLETKELKVFKYGQENYYQAFEAYIRDADTFIGHSIIGFDRHVISHFTDLPLIPVVRCIDTLVRSRLYNSGRDGGHSLERWGAYFGIAKVGADYDDWENFNPIIVERCKRDVLITKKLYEFQLQEGKHVGKLSEQIEHRFTEFADEIRDNGFPIDVNLLDKKYMEMSARKDHLESLIRESFPPRAKLLSEVTPKITKAGDFAKNTKGFKAFDDSGLVQGPFSLIEWEEFNIGSPKQVVERMDEAGWKPTVKTKSGNSYKVCEENLATLPDTAPTAAKHIKEFLNVKTRLQLMDNWYENLDKDTDKVHGSIIPIGAITHRCAHRDPNTANIPGNDDEYNVRDCWAVPLDGDDRLVGVDAKGIQLRILAHLLARFTDNKEFMDAVLTGDPHVDFTLPRIAAIYPDCVAYTTPEEKHIVKQTKTKRFIYAYLLGAGSGKSGSIFGLGVKEGKNIKEGFDQAFPGMPDLKRFLKVCAQKGWFPAPDGRFIPIKSEHYALACALQGIEAIVMKLAGLLAIKETKKRGLRALYIAFVHDEFVLRCHKDDAQEAGEILAEMIGKAGEMLGLLCPMEGDAPKIGYTWTEIH